MPDLTCAGATAADGPSNTALQVSMFAGGSILFTGSVSPTPGYSITAEDTGLLYGANSFFCNMSGISHTIIGISGAVANGSLVGTSALASLYPYGLGNGHAFIANFDTETNIWGYGVFNATPTVTETITINGTITILGLSLDPTFSGLLCIYDGIVTVIGSDNNIYALNLTTLEATPITTFSSAPYVMSLGGNVYIGGSPGGTMYLMAVAIPPPPVPGSGFMLATGDTLSPSSGPAALTTCLLPPLDSVVGGAASYVHAPWGAALVFYGGSPVYTLQLPEDVGLPAYESAPKQQYTWRSKKFVFPGQTTFAAAKVVHSCQGGGVRFRLYIDCCCVYETVVRGCVPFRLPPQLRGITCEIELIGCSRVTEVRVASSIRELMGDE
jgi:hypothetical protein